MEESEVIKSFKVDKKKATDFQDLCNLKGIKFSSYIRFLMFEELKKNKKAIREN